MAVHTLHQGRMEDFTVLRYGDGLYMTIYMYSVYRAYVCIQCTHTAMVNPQQVNADPVDGIYFHYVHEPSGPWWDLAKPMVKMVKTYNLSTFMGHALKYRQHAYVVVLPCISVVLQ